MANTGRPEARHRWGIPVLATLAALIVVVSSVPAKHVRVGTLWDEFQNAGNEAWGGTAMVWPGGFWKEDYGSENYSQATASYKAFLYGAQNYTVPNDGAWADASWGMTKDETPGTVMPYYVVQRDIKNTPGINGWQLLFGTDSLIYRSNPALVKTNGVENNAPQLPGGLGASTSRAFPENPSLPADVKHITTWGNHMGVWTTRTVYASVHPLHDDYLIWHYNLANTGKYCCANAVLGNTAKNPDAIMQQTLHNFHFSHSFWFLDRSEGGRKTGQQAENLGDNLNHYKGHAYTAPYAVQDVTSDTKQIFQANAKYSGMTFVDAGHPVNNYGRLRLQYAWDGDGPGYQGEDSGDPDRLTGRMMEAKWPGVALIHADVSVTDRTDDPDQPKRSDYDNHNRMPQLNLADLPGAYEFLYKGMTPSGPLVAGGLDNRFQSDAVRAGVPYAADATNIKFRGSETILSVGNWEVPFGESINVIWVNAVGGLPYQEAVELGKRQNLPDADLDQLALQYAAAGEPKRVTEEMRLRKFFTLEDSLFTLVKRAQDVIGRNATSSIADLETRLAATASNQGYSVGPPNVATLNVDGGVGQIKLTWTAPTSRASEVSKYRVYRARGTRVGDFPWVNVSGDLTGTTMSFTDNLVSVGIQYFYYVVTVNAAGVESSAHMARTEKGVTPSTAASAAVVDSGVYVVPNPFDARYQTATFVPAKGQPIPDFANQVLFYGLSNLATIHIYTLDGVQVRTLSHAAANGNEAWDLMSDTGQLVVSGVYIYVVESTAGRAVGKIVIVR